MNKLKVFNRQLFCPLLAVLILTALVAPLQAQRAVSYSDLAYRPREAAVFFTFNPVPLPPSDSVTFAVSFRISFDYLAFTKPLDTDDPVLPEGFEYFSKVQITLEMGEADTTKRNGAAENRPVETMQGRPARQRNSRPAPQATPAGEVTGPTARFRATWNGLAMARSYDETRSGVRYLEGLMFITIPYGVFDYVIVLRESGRADERAGSVRRLVVSRKEPAAYSAPVLLDTYRAGVSSLPLLNLSNNCFYGRDFSLAITVPAGSTRIKEVVISEAPRNAPPPQTGKKSSKKTESAPVAPPAAVFTLPAKEALRIKNTTLIYPDKNKAEAMATPSETFDLLVFQVPASRLKNSNYQLTVKDTLEKTVWAWRFLTLWRDMPRALLNLDIAIDMLKYMIGKDQLKELKTGKPADREQKFRAFWTARDPSPGTEFNELMNEYYRRIDYSFDKFSTPQRPGYESDQGQTYIRMGPPLRTRRDFSTGNAAIEIWEYPGQEIIFRATSGFGDFERIK
jgi:GWxTD domain-containing protein